MEMKVGAVFQGDAEVAVAGGPEGGMGLSGDESAEQDRNDPVRIR